MRDQPHGAKEANMKTRGEGMAEDEDAMRPEYDFSEGVRGMTAQR